MADNPLAKRERQELAHNGRPVRNSKEQVANILAPMFLFFGMDLPELVVNIWIDHLRDLEPARLAKAVSRCIDECKFKPTLADIRERYEEERQARPRPLRLAPGEDDPPKQGWIGQRVQETQQERWERLKRIERRERLYGYEH